MRNPYVTGGWVCGPEHYGRGGTIAHLLESSNDAVWVIGNRRIGKTSLLRQLEFLTRESERYVPLFWDMQGCSDLGELGEELVYAVEDEEERFNRLLVDVNLLRNWEVDGVLRLLRRYARAAGKTLLLLCDEGEALLSVAERDPDGLARLRKVMQSGNGLRVVLASTKILSRINELSRDWLTSPFLFGFGLRNLAGLHPNDSARLIRQTQHSHPIEVSDEQVRKISNATNHHPYLIQVLCSRLFVPDGYLRPLEPTDLTLDPVLRGFFDNDFRWLSPGEKQVLLSVAAGNHDQDSIVADTGLSHAAVQAFVFSMDRLSQLRQYDGQVDIANEFLRRWLEENYESLLEESLTGEVTDETTQLLIRKGQEQDAAYALEQLRVQQANLRELELQRAQFGLRVPLDLINDINRVKMEIEVLEQRLALIPDDILQSAREQVASGEVHELQFSHSPG